MAASSLAEALLDLKNTAMYQRKSRVHDWECISGIVHRTVVIFGLSRGSHREESKFPTCACSIRTRIPQKAASNVAEVARGSPLPCVTMTFLFFGGRILMSVRALRELAVCRASSPATL